MGPEERATFRLEEGLGGSNPSVYERVIRKVYGKDQGWEILAALGDNPVVAVPIVLSRLKQKDEEWKRAEREWNKVWREVVSLLLRWFRRSAFERGGTGGLTWGSFSVTGREELLPLARPPGRHVQADRQEGDDDAEIPDVRD